MNDPGGVQADLAKVPSVAMALPLHYMRAPMYCTQRVGVFAVVCSSCSEACALACLSNPLLKWQTRAQPCIRVDQPASHIAL